MTKRKLRDDEPETYDEAAERIHRAFCDPEHEKVSYWDQAMADALRRNGYRIVRATEQDEAVWAVIRRHTGTTVEDALACHAELHATLTTPPPALREGGALRCPECGVECRDLPQFGRHWSLRHTPAAHDPAQHYWYSDGCHISDVPAVPALDDVLMALLQAASLQFDLYDERQLEAAAEWMAERLTGPKEDER